MKIWCPSQFADIHGQNCHTLERFIRDHYMPTSDFRIAIVGGGPKGSYAVERVASMWNDNFPKRELDLVVFNESHYFGAGPNYQPDQPDYLLMNYQLGKVNFWTDEKEQLVKDRPTLLEFLNKHLLESDEPIQSEEYCTRSLTGVYLQYCLCLVAKALPANIRLHLIKDKVRAITEEGGVVNLTSQSTCWVGFSEVICCTGHSYEFSSLGHPGVPKKKTQGVYPVNELEAGGMAGKTILIKGLGLTFIDAVLALSEGKGGTFFRRHGKLHYEKSGKEPKLIYGFSRSGLPMVSRQEDSLNIPLKYFTEEAMVELMNGEGKIDFQATILPLIEKEFRYRYARLYSRIVGKCLLPSSTLEELEDILVNTFPEYTPINVENYLYPKYSTGDVHQQLLNALESMLFPYTESVEERAKLGLSTIWRDIYPYFSRLYAFGRLTGEGQKLFDKKYRPGLQRVSYGPPKINVEKILALIEADMLRFDLAVNPQLTFSEQEGVIITKDPTGKVTIKADFLIDARVPAPGSFSHPPEYIRNLRDYMAMSFFIHEGYYTGCPDLDKKGRLRAHPKIAFYGTPTEGCTLDNESLSRENNNVLSPWVNQLIKTNAKTATSSANAYSTSLD